MNAKQQIHNATLNEWLTIFKDQAASGQTIKTWCADHNLSINAYYYWKRIAKESYLDSVGPDIVPVSLPIATPSEPTESSASSECYSHELANLPNLDNSHNLPNLYNSRKSNDIAVSIGDITINIGSSASNELITRIIGAVRNA